MLWSCRVAFVVFVAVCVVVVLIVFLYVHKAFYSDPENRALLDVDVGVNDYVAGGIVVFDLMKLQVRYVVLCVAMHVR